MTTESSAGETGYLEGVSASAPAVETPQPQGAPDANPAAAPSPAATIPDAKEPTSLLEAVQAAARAGTGEAPSTSEASPAQPATPAPATGEAKPAAKDELPPFHTHPRWQALVRERDAYKAGAESFQQLQGFMTKADLSPQEVNVGFEIMRLMKNEPEKALAALKPYVEQLSKFTGEKLPDDLQQKVDQGFIAEDLARDMVRDRSAAAMAAHNSQAAAVKAQQQVYAEIGSTLSRWETAWQKSDPDYAKVQPLVLAEIERQIQARGLPPTSAAAVQLAEAVLRQTRTYLGQFVPKPTPAQPVRGGTVVAASPEPKTMREAMELAARRA